MIIFPKNFLWGAATSGPQTESSSYKDKKSKTIWDEWFEKDPNKFFNKIGPDNTNETYLRFEEDVECIKKLNLKSFRTSIMWSRIIPDGKTVNLKAINFYKNYFKALKKLKVKLFVCLHHFDVPLWMMQNKGWENKENIKFFIFYCKTVFKYFSKYVDYWITFNEPLVHAECGYLNKYHPPLVVDLKRAIQVAYNMIIASAYAIKTFKEKKSKAKIGIVLNLSPIYSKDNKPENLLAQKNAQLLLVDSFTYACAYGKFKKELKQLLTKNNLMPEVLKSELNVLKQNCVDFIGVNYYQPIRVQAPNKKTGKKLLLKNFYQPYVWKKRIINPSRGWEIYPKGIYDIGQYMNQNFSKLKWYISENGMGVMKEEKFKNKNDLIEDEYRIDFIKQHLIYLNLILKENKNCFGYHIWTLIDCWSWLNAYKNRYGLFNLDLKDNKKRKLKKSGIWFKELIKNNGFKE